MNRSFIQLFLVEVVCVLFCPMAGLLSQVRDSLHFPIQDRRGDRYTWQNNNPFDLNDTSIIKQNIQYDPKTNQYYIVEKIGKTLYRKPTYLSFEEYYFLQTKQSEAAYFKQRSDALSALNRKVQRPKPHVYDRLFDRIFGIGKDGLKVDIKPQGSVDLSLGYQGQNTLNPILPEAARKTGGLDFNMNANLNVNANIGDKLKFPINYNTLANFDYLNKMKLNYKGMDDEIIRSIEAGNISFQTKGSLIPGAQDLFGLKTQLQFGRLTVTAVLANQRSQQQSQSSSGGTSTTSYKKKLSDYDENRHFLMAQYFKTNFKSAMSKLPVVNSQVNIQSVEVWVTNRTGTSTDARMVVGLMDLGENLPYNSNVHSLTSNTLPFNGSNDLYSSLVNNSANRNATYITSNLTAKGLSQVKDFEKVYARKLSSSEYYFNSQVGFISLNTQLQSDDVLAIAYQYTYNGRVYQVGEFSKDVALDSTSGVQKVLFLKLLKATAASVQLPIWNLMMKNVYSLDLSSVSKTGFTMNVLYQQSGGGLNKYLPESAPAVSGKALLSILNLDRLNSNNDAHPDGVFDFIDSFTILSKQGKIIFPQLQPFGRDLDTLAFSGQSQSMKNKYVFYALYDSIKTIAQVNTNLDRFYMQGQAKGSKTSSVSLGAYNLSQGSVKVTASGQTLTEGVDYIVDYSLGTVTVINQSIINSGVAVNVSYENSTTGVQQKGFLGVRLDYAVNKKLSFGATMERLNEKPYFSKISYGEDPIRNTMLGMDFSYQSNWPGLTRALNKLPFFTTKALSSVSAYGEFAYFKPGQASGTDGSVYIDDFEGTISDIDLRFPWTSWALASTPSRFSEAAYSDNLDYGKNRAKIAWYNIESTLQDKSSSSNPLRSNLTELSDPRVRIVYTNELFPKTTITTTNTQTTTFDIAYYPTDIGPYNYENSATQVDANGKLKSPKTRWGGLMRAIDQTDFETNNIDAVEFWVQDPFIKNATSTGGKLYMDLGSVSEDILKDGKHFFENGMSTASTVAATDTSKWGKVPLDPVQVTNAFSSDAADRPLQDIGLDGLNDDSERVVFSNYLKNINSAFGSNSSFYQRAIVDPSNDDYTWYRDSKFDVAGIGILGRYKNYNNPQGNSSVTTGSSITAATTYPDNEDINHDNTMNETESYYEYEINLNAGMTASTNKYISDVRSVSVTYPNGSTGTENWYLFRVPVKNYTKVVGDMTDFKSIRFIRLYLSGFEDSVVCRFAKFDLVRSQWRQFTYDLDTTGSYTTINNTTTTFNTLSVNLEENSSRTPVNYLIPPGITRVQTLNSSGTSVLENEQSLSLQVHDLAVGDARAVYKTLALDMRKYGKISMFAHAESVVGKTAIKDNELNLVIRIGQDYLSNYYEIKIPLKVTAAGFYTAAQASIVWPSANNLDFNLQDLVSLKKRRNAKTGQLQTTIYRELINGKTFSVMGNPNLGAVEGILMAVENDKSNAAALSSEVWLDEFRLSGINNKGAYAATGKVDVVLADLGKLSVSANTHSQGWGTLDSHISDRVTSGMKEFDAVLNINAGKLMPKKLRLSVPLYASLSRIVYTPEYDPNDLDVKLKDKLSMAATRAARDSIKNATVNQTTVKTINLTNIHIQPKGKIHLWSLSNFDISYAYSKTSRTNPVDAIDDLTKWRFALGYNYQSSTKYIQPFKKMIKSKSPWLGWMKDFNFSLKPSLLSVKTDINRQFGIDVPRIVNTGSTVSKITSVDTTYDKYFTFDRYYNIRWDLSHSLNFDFSATNNATVDEPDGILDTKEKRDILRRNFWKGGRTTNYQQTTSLRYTFPLNKLPLTDWITASYNYGTSYNWIGASTLAISLGNTLENSQTNTFASDLDFTRLYSKSRFLKSLNALPKQARSSDRNANKASLALTRVNQTAINPVPPLLPAILQKPLPSREEVITDKNGNKLIGKKKREALHKWRQQKRDYRLAKKLQQYNQTPKMNAAVKVGAQLLTMIKHVGVTYSEDYNSRVPGFMDSTQLIGQDWKSMQPGLDYVFGKQPDTGWLNKKAARGLMTSDSSFNSYYVQDFAQKFGLTVQLEPVKELKIDITFDKTFSKRYTELFKDTLFSNNTTIKQHLNPSVSGGFSVSYIGINTLFQKTSINQVSAIFQKFQDNRVIISNRVAQQNPYWVAAGKQTNAKGYAIGYGQYSQDVLIPSFLSAYTGKSPYTIALVKESSANIKSNPFGGYLPKPNWRLSYSGLSKIPALAKIFSAINITNAYSGTLSMNSYTSSLSYSDVSKYGSPGFIDSTSGNYVPFYVVPNITMQEQFAPLIGIEVTTLSQLSLKLVYNRSRQLSLSLVDYQVSETSGKEWIFGFGWRKKGIRLPFKLPGMLSKNLLNDISFKFDMSLRDDATTVATLDAGSAYTTAGQKVISILPSIDYVLNKRVSLKLYFTQRRTTPYISTTAPTIITTVGLQTRISLSQ